MEKKVDKQKTINKPVSLEGAGLHTGNKTKVTLKPAPANSGINFIRVDLGNSMIVKPIVESVLDLARSPRRTSVGFEGTEIHTVEHLLAALSSLGVDNLYIELNNNELPGLDGSAKEFVEAIERVGIKELDAEKNSFALKEPIFIEDGDSLIVAIPSDELKISYTLDYKHPHLKSQFFDMVINADTFKEHIAGARTFCLEEEASFLKEQGLGKGADYNNTIVVGASGVIKNKLRFEDEFVRHKVLDLIGDLSLIGVPLKAHIIALKSGHNLNAKLLKRIRQQQARQIASGVGSTEDFVINEGEILDVEAIMKILPHRQPFLFVDRVISMEPGKRAVGIKNVTMNDYFFQGHFPKRPVMPGVLIIEALAQVGGVLMLSPPENRGKLAFFMAVDNAKFRKPVVPGDQLMLEVVVGKIRSRTGQVITKAYVDGKVVCEADLMFAFVD